MINLADYGYIEYAAPPDGLIPGRVTEVQRALCTVVTELGEASAVLKGSYYLAAETSDDFPCVGDFVLLSYNSSGTSRIAEILPRRTKFSRADFSGHGAKYVKTILEQVVAANFDYVFIMSSLNRDFNVNRITRYLTQVWQSGAQPVIILTKADLGESLNLDELYSSAPDIPIHTISSLTGLGMDALEAYLRPGKTVVFLGMSGVGKSSLLNALMRDEVMAVSGIREDDSRGRHTTTHRELFMLPSGAMIIDTPGMRELGLFGAAEGISAGFADVEALFEDCRFSDCRHQTEPGCAVLRALTDGSLPQERWERYLAQTRENEFAADKAEYLSDKRARHKSIAQRNKQAKKSGRIRY